MTEHTCRCTTCGDYHVRFEPPLREREPYFAPRVHCPICYTYGHSHRKDCANADTGMQHHVPLNYFVPQ